MSPDQPEPAPPLDAEDITLEASLPSLRPRSATPDFLERLHLHLEMTVSDETAASSPDSPPMPLDASLLAFEHELRLLRPLEMDFPTGQRVLRALESEMTPAAAPPFSVLNGGSQPMTSRRRWSAAAPWAAAAALVAAGMVALPYLPRPGGPALADHQGLIPWATTGERGSIALVFPTTPGTVEFGARSGELRAGDNSGARMGSITIPEVTAPQAEGLLNVTLFNLSDDYRRKREIAHGVAIYSMGDGGPASTQGLEVGDIILRLNGAPVSTAEEFTAMIKNSAPGSVVTLRVLRGRLFGDLRVRLGAAPSA
jgi:hypothetical protein